MGWEVLIPIIAQYGIPLAESLFTKFTSGNPPTAADFSELRQLASQRESDLMKARLNAAGISLDSERGIALLGLVK